MFFFSYILGEVRPEYKEQGVTGEGGLCSCQFEDTCFRSTCLSSK